MTKVTFTINTRNFSNGVSQAIRKISSGPEASFNPARDGKLSSKLTLTFKTKQSAIDGFETFKSEFIGPVVNPVMVTGKVEYALYESARLLPVVIAA